MLTDRLTPAVKTILMVNVAVFLAMSILDLAKSGFFENVALLLAQYPPDLVHGQLWRPLTYMFVHGDVFHLLFNMLILFFFAGELESRWGTRYFTTFYLVSGAGAALIQTALYYLGIDRALIIGASGAIFAVQLAFAAYYPEAEIYIWGVLPVKMKILMPVLIGMNLLSIGGPEVSYVTHLGGIFVGYVMLSIRHRDWDIRHWRWRN